MKRYKGFTLIEIIILITIIGILTAILIPQIKKYNGIKAGIVEQKDFSTKDAEQIVKSRTFNIKYEKHCFEGYVFIVNAQDQFTINQLIDASGNGVLCEDKLK